MTDQRLQHWGDSQMYAAAPMDTKRDAQGNIVPTVHLLWMTPDPLGAVAAMCRMYEGKPTYSLADITDDERRHYFAQAQKTHLRAPLEAVKFHFFLEGVTRSFTHQMVRQRTAVYAQESLRFAVKERFANEISTPPSIAALPRDSQAREEWEFAILEMERSYMRLIDLGIPAEDARGLLPHAITTRIHYVTDLRNLLDHAGNRLCTQAQFEWRAVFIGILRAIDNYEDDSAGAARVPDLPSANAWQFHELARSGLFKPVCYALGHCPFTAVFDRDCTIRERVQQGRFDDIKTEEWLTDPTAARRGSAGHD